MLAYIDDSGKLHYKDSNERSSWAAVCIPRDEVRLVNQKMFAIKMDIFGDPDRELKAKNQLVRKSLSRNTHNKLFVDRVVKEVIQKTNGLAVFAVVMERPDSELEFPDDSLPSYHKYLLQRINSYASRHRVKAIVAYDQQDQQKDLLLSNQVKGFLFKSNEGKMSDSVVESAFFVNSVVEEGIQLADLCAGIIRLHHELTMPGKIQDDFSNWINELYEIVSSTTRTTQDPFGNDLFGIYRVPKRNIANYTKITAQ